MHNLNDMQVGSEYVEAFKVIRELLNENEIS